MEQNYDEYDEWEKYRTCEICFKESETTIRCPQLWDDLGDKGTRDKYICENCCKDYLFWDCEYISDGCGGDCGTDIPKKFFENRLKEIASQEGLIESKKNKGIFSNKCKTILFGNCTIYRNSYPSFIEEDKLEEISAIYFGEYATFIKKQSGEIKVYNTEWIQEVKKLFLEMKERWPEGNPYSFYSYKGLFLIQGSFTWALVQYTENTNDLLDRESPNFQNLLLNGIEFFNIHLQRPLHISFERMTPDDFELFCVDLLKSESFKNVTRIGGTSGDDGMDILATEELNTFDGVEDRKWQVQCKNISTNLNFDDIAKEHMRACANNVDGLLYIVSTDLTSPTKRKIADYNVNPKNQIQIRYYNKNKIESILLRKPELLKKWVCKI